MGERGLKDVLLKTCLLSNLTLGLWPLCLLAGLLVSSALACRKVVFSPQYPYRPPSILMLTPSGRFAIQQKLCLSISDFHPESWYVLLCDASPERAAPTSPASVQCSSRTMQKVWRP